MARAKRNAPGAATPEASDVQISDDQNPPSVTPPPGVSTDRPSSPEDVLELRVTPLSAFFRFREEADAADCAWSGFELHTLACRARCNGAEAVLEAALDGFSAVEVAEAVAAAMDRLEGLGASTRTPAVAHLQTICTILLEHDGDHRSAAAPLARVTREHSDGEDLYVEAAFDGFAGMLSDSVEPPGYLAAYFTMALARLVDARALDYFALRVIEAAHEARILRRSGCSRMPSRRGREAAVR